MIINFFKSHKVFIIVLLSLLVFSPALFNYFSGDDWFHLRISNIGNINPLMFFSFIPNETSAAFYRPLSTQFFFHVFYQLFGLNSFPYYLFGLLLFGIILTLIYQVNLQLSNSKYVALITLIIYAFSATNFSRLYFLSAYQELFMVCFVLLTIKYTLKNNIWISSVFFILSLSSKETAIVIPFILLAMNLILKNVKIKTLIPLFLISLAYFYLRFHYFGIANGDSYVWNFSPLKAVNTLFWYTLWSFGAPEMLVDYVGTGLKILPRFFVQFPFWSWLILSTLGLSVLSFLSLLLKVRKLNSLAIFGILIYLLGLMPVIFLPQHKFTLELTLPLWGFSLFIAWVLSQNKKVLSAIFIGIFLLTNFCSYLISYQTSYIRSRAKISRAVIEFLNKNYPQNPGKPFFISNNIPASQTSKEWGDSKQIAQSISSSDLFKVYYKDLDFKVYFEDLNKNSDNNFIKISTSTIYNQINK